MTTASVADSASPVAAKKAAASVLVVEGVTKSYGSLRAVDNISLTVSPGEFVALLGPNGAGKSTLLQLITGLFTPDQGRIIVLGHDLRHEAIRALASLGVVFQQQTLDLELSVRGNLLVHTDLHGMARRVARERVQAALARFGLADRARDRTRVLSGGSRRRLELARALLHGPRVLLMDEATVGLDPVSRRDLISDIVRLKKEENLGVLWATHLVDEAEQADRVVVLAAGRVLYDGTVRGLLEREGSDDLEATVIQMMGKPSLAAGPGLENAFAGESNRGKIVEQ
jgi:ABC-2 type transport system ATP-binding protein